LTIKTTLLILSPAFALYTYYHYKKSQKKSSKSNDDIHIDSADVNSELRLKFEQATKKAAEVRSKMDNGDILLIYGLYKQATCGDANQDEKPSGWNVLATYKFDAWCKFEGLTKEEAMERYIEINQHFFEMDENADMIYDDDEESFDEDADDATKAVNDPSIDFGLGLKPSSLNYLLDDEEDEDEMSTNEEKLWYAASKGDLPAVRNLLSTTTKCDINSYDDDGQTALHFSSDKGFSEIVKLLLKSGADPNASDDNGISVLQTAVISGSSVEVIKALLEAGADPDAKDCDGDSARSCAEECDNMDIRVLFK